jgi:hypothetical protein
VYDATQIVTQEKIKEKFKYWILAFDSRCVPPQGSIQSKWVDYWGNLIFSSYFQERTMELKGWYRGGDTYKLHSKLGNINLHNVTHSLISQNSRERMFKFQISVFIVTFLSLIPWNLSLIQTTQEVNPHPRTAPCVNMCQHSSSSSSSSSTTCWMLVHALATSPGKAKWSGPQ